MRQRKTYKCNWRWCTEPKFIAMRCRKYSKPAHFDARIELSPLAVEKEELLPDTMCR